jgi:hypothetical protein
MIARAMLGLALLAGALASPVAAAPAPPAASAALRPALDALQALDTRVQSVGWKLAAGNARWCARPVPAIGLQLFDAASFGDPGAVRAALALAGDIAVEAVADGSPAGSAGLSPHLPVSAIAGKPTEPAGAPPLRSAYARLVALHDAIDAALVATNSVTLAVGSGAATRTVTITGQPVCASRFEMLTEDNHAAADGTRVVVSRKLVEFLPADDELAALLAHELAHNILGHRARLDASGRSWGNILATEREADRLSVWLLAAAGYDPEAALRFMARWGPANDNGIFSTPDHDRWKTRIERMTREIAALRTAVAADPAHEVNWPRDFARG